MSISTIKNINLELLTTILKLVLNIHVFISVQESAETLGQAASQGNQMQDGLPQRMQERTNGPQPRTKRKRRQLTLTGPGTNIHLRIKCCLEIFLVYPMSARL